MRLFDGAVDKMSHRHGLIRQLVVELYILVLSGQNQDLQRYEDF